MNRLKELRLKAGLSQAALGSLMHVSQRHIAFIERGERSPSLDLAVQLAKHFGVSVEEIFLLNNCTKSTEQSRGEEH